MQTLYLIRHTTPAIEPGICYGQLDIGVGNNFEHETADVLRWLPPLQLVISSPLRRTRLLGECISQKQHCELRHDPRLMEKHFGIWEGKAWHDIARSELDAWAGNLMGYAPVGGESAQQLMLRAESFLQELPQLQAKNIALVTHAGSIRAMLALLEKTLLGNTLHWEIDYGAVIAIQL